MTYGKDYRISWLAELRAACQARMNYLLSKPDSEDEIEECAKEVDDLDAHELYVKRAMSVQLSAGC